MNTRNTIISSILFVVLCLVAASPTLAANIPSISLSNSSGSSAVTVTILQADPNASVLLYYPSSGGYTSVNIGTTNSSGYLTTSVNSTQYGIAAGVPVYASVDNIQSMTQVWPNYTASGGLSLSQSMISLLVGQTAVVSASVSAPLSLGNNVNPAIAGAVISGNQITITGLAFGTTNITVCASNIGCGNVQVSVSASAAATASVSLSQSAVSISAGQSQQIFITGSGSYYLSSNSNSGVATASISGSTLTVVGVSTGTDSLSVCSYSGGSTTCANLSVTVASSAVNTSTTITPSLSFSQSQVNMSIGQTQMVSIYGGNGAPQVYYVSQNSAPDSVSANTNGATVSLSAMAFGGANITVCQSGGPCGTFYVYVAPSVSGSSATISPASNVSKPAVASLSVLSNDTGGFAGAGSVLSISISFNQSISVPDLSIGGLPVTVSGSGSGPYTASYTVPINTTTPIPIVITFANPQGTGGQAFLWIGNDSSANLVGTPVPSTVTHVSAVSTVSGIDSYVFGRYLYMGMTKQGVADPDVTALQKYLAKAGFYSGPVTGYFGPLTKAAVQAYQKAHGLDTLGVVGPATRALMNAGK
ncbi:peptidoglycan-binding protein [Patescibacteria group bacterium]|nr:peptidoglycan-binding protein [Patescibacteria group bacterium]MDE1946401.1 peptidoglycan-binding protein [Patescibacteria group bacterium]MDE2011010.1 peptidoglycan-binding protein [Patescibacteria group bacterium]MDE2233033.1 peptidoglycan-binding protein [Patescibacteria group bacterium]